MPDGEGEGESDGGREGGREVEREREMGGVHVSELSSLKTSKHSTWWQ